MRLRHGPMAAITFAAITFASLLAVTPMASAQSPGASPQSPGASPQSPGASPPASSPSTAPVAFRLTTEAFEDGGQIPERHTCDGEDVSPPLAWEGVPDGTVSLALIVADPDADGWAHWVVFDIDPTLTGLLEGASGTGAGFREGTNEFPQAGWAGPCPPEGTEHSYGFGLFALDTLLGLEGEPTADEVRAAMDGHVLARTDLTGLRAR